MAHKTFVIADDATFIRTILKDMIEQHEDYKVVGEAKNGIEAVEKATMLQPDIMTIDITMPELDGFEALPQIINNCPNTKIIVVSALGNQEHILKALRRGARDFVVKPFDKDRVFAAIESVLNEDAI